MTETEDQGRPWGMCAAYGCPLLGSVGSEGKWYCFCHCGRPSSMNDAISMKLRSDDCWAIVEAALSIRRCFGSFGDKPDEYRRVQARLVNAGRKDMLMGEADCSPYRPGKPIVKMWLARLESELIRMTCSSIVVRPSGIVQTASVIGPTHALQHFTEVPDGRPIPE